jgi:transposase
VVCIDEMGPLACIPRGGRAWGKKPARRPDRYHPSHTIQLLAAFAPHTGEAIGVPSPNKTGEVVLTFLQKTVLPRFGADRKIYVVWDNFSAHKRARNLWANAVPNIEFFWTPTNASWLNLIEPWFLVLEKTALYNTDLKTTDAIAENLKQGIDYLNNHPRPYRWTKTL